MSALIAINNPVRIRIIKETASAGVIFFFLTLIFTWPLPLVLRSDVIGPFLGDNLEYIWKLWWVKHALVDLKQSPLMHPDIYYPFGYPLASGEITPLHTYFGLPLTTVFGPVVTYNLFILGSVFLTGFFTFLYVRELTGRATAGLFSGLIFAFIPYRMARIAGHLPLVDTQWIPLYLLFLERTLKRPSARSAALAGLFFAASTLSTWYYGFALAVLSPIYFLGRGGWSAVKANWRSWRMPALSFTGIVVIIIVPFLVPYLQMARLGDNEIPLAQTVFWSASLTDLLTPNPRNFLWGEVVQRTLTPFGNNLPYEFILNWGFVSSLLAFSGWRQGRKGVKQGWVLWIGVSTILSLGPVLKLFGVVVTLSLPEVMGGRLQSVFDWIGLHSFAREFFPYQSATRGAIPLPALFLRWFFPGMDGLRSWGRFALFGAFGVAVLAGEGLIAGIDRASQMKINQEGTHKRTVFGPNLFAAIWLFLFGGLTLFEFYTGPQPLITPGPRSVDLWLADLDERGTIIQLPVPVALSGPQMYYSMFNNQRLASGYGTYFPILFEDRYPALDDFPSDEAIDLLEAWGEGSGKQGGIDYILIDELDVLAGDPLWRLIEGQPRLRHVVTADSVRVYTVP